jgi:hypothetical protein
MLPSWGRVNSINMQKVLWALDAKRPHMPGVKGYHEFLKLRPAFQKQIMNP